MDLEKFKKMSEEEQKTYDFKDTFASECIHDNSLYKDEITKVWERLKDEKNIVVKLKEWKHNRFFALPGEKNKNIGHDCDSTLLSLQILSQIRFGRIGEIKYHHGLAQSNESKRIDFVRELNFNGKAYMGDTMNSFQTIANIALTLLLDEKYIERKLADSNSTYLNAKYTFEVLEELFEFIRENKKDQLKECFKIDDISVDNKIGILEKLEKLARLTHTMGNFLLVPAGTFNGARYTPTKDFFDLALEGIRQYYLDEEHTGLCGILRFNEQNACWLDSFKVENDENGEKSWQNFVNRNLLNDYVEEIDGKYIVKLFFDDHSFKNDTIEPKLGDLGQCLTSMCEMIELRSDRVYKAINCKPKIYVSHSKKYDYENELYKPLLESRLAEVNQLVLPHSEEYDQVDTKQVLASCDVLIAEVSIPGLGIGLELGRAEANHMQIVCLLKKGVSCNSSVKRNYPVIKYCDSIDMIKKLEDFLLK